MRHYTPAWIGEATSSSRKYFTDYSSGSASRNRRKPGLTLLQDDIALAENAESTHSQSRIVKEVQWHMSEERIDAEADNAHPPSSSHRLSYAV